MASTTGPSCANDLTIAVNELNVRYKMAEYTTEFRAILATLGISPLAVADFQKTPNYTHPDDLEEVTVSEEILDKLQKEYRKLQKKYKYREYMLEGIKLRTDFLAKRTDYICGKIRFTTGDKKKTRRKLNFLDRLAISRIEDLYLGRWLDSVVEKVYPKVCAVKFEDLAGRIKQVRVVKKTDQFYENETADVECALIDRESGISCFDSFYLHSYYDLDAKQWIYISPRLILSVYSEACNVMEDLGESTPQRDQTPLDSDGFDDDEGLIDGDQNDEPL
jgi:hypothetical protein